jgi:hypothetical protein
LEEEAGVQAELDTPEGEKEQVELDIPEEKDERVEITDKNAETDGRVEVARKPEVAVTTHRYQLRQNRRPPDRY